MKPDIVDFTETPIAVLEHHGPPGRIMETVSAFIEWRKQSTASPVARCRTFGIVYGDPEGTPPEDFRFDVCGELKGPLEKNSAGIVEKSIAGGRCAVVRHMGRIDNIGPTVRSLYADWLPDSGEELRDAPCFFHYVKRMPTVSEHEQVTDIYLPIK